MFFKFPWSFLVVSCSCSFFILTFKGFLYSYLLYIWYLIIPTSEVLGGLFYSICWLQSCNLVSLRVRWVLSCKLLYDWNYPVEIRRPPFSVVFLWRRFGFHPLRSKRCCQTWDALAFRRVPAYSGSIRLSSTLPKTKFQISHQRWLRKSSLTLFLHQCLLTGTIQDSTHHFSFFPSWFLRLSPKPQNAV